MTAAARHSLGQGFADPVFAAQSVFRAVMLAMARPGAVQALPHVCAPPAPLGASLAALTLTLCDFETPIWLDAALARSPAVHDYLRFHAGAPLTRDPAEAAFALVSEPLRLASLSAFARGSPEYPDRSTTLILQVDMVRQDGPARLIGPGIDGERRFGAEPLPPGFWADMRDNHALFPRGIDVVFAAPASVAALPRSTRTSLDEV